MRAAGLGPLGLAKPVMILAGIAFLILMTLSAYFLPASNREFKDAQFEIRNRFVSSLLQEGSFTTISGQIDDLHRRARRARRGARHPDRRRAATRRARSRSSPTAAPSPTAAKRPLTACHGQRRPPGNRPEDRQAVAPHLRPLHARPRHRARRAGGAIPRAAGAIPRRAAVPAGRAGRIGARALQLYARRRIQRLAVPLSVFGFAIIPLACLLPGEINRRGQLKAGSCWRSDAAPSSTSRSRSAVQNMASRYAVAIPFDVCVIDLLPVALGLWNPDCSGRIRLSLRRDARRLRRWRRP